MSIVNKSWKPTTLEEVLKKSEERFRQVVESAPNAMVMITRGA